MDPTTIFVNLGLETYVEMSLEQATKFVAARTRALETAVSSLKAAEFQIKANIRLMYEVNKSMHFFTANPSPFFLLAFSHISREILVSFVPGSTGNPKN